MNHDERKLWVFLLLVVALVAFGTGCLLTYPKPLGFGGLPTSAPKASAVLPSEHPSSNSKGAGAKPADADFSGALDGLHGALQNHPGMTERELILQVNAKRPAGSAKPCPFEWHQDEAELQVQQDPNGKISLARTIASCTQAVEKLP